MNPNRKPGFFDYGGKLWGWCQALLSVIFLNLLFLVGCLPVLTVGTSMLALTEVSIDRARYGGEVFPIFKEFWDAYKRHLRRGIPLTIALALVFGSLFLDFLWLSAGALFQGLFGVLAALSIMLCMILIYYIPLLCSGQYSLWNGVIEAFFISFAHWSRSLPATLVIVVLITACLYIPNLFLALLPVMIVVGFALIAAALAALVEGTLPDAEDAAYDDEEES